MSKATLRSQDCSVIQQQAKQATRGHMDHLRAVGDPVTGKPIGTTSANLEAAIVGETFEYTNLYPAMAATAREEGFPEIADRFETLAKAEHNHADRFRRVPSLKA